MMGISSLAMHEYNDCFDESAREILVRAWRLDKLDESIAELRKACIETERRIWRAVERKYGEVKET